MTRDQIVSSTYEGRTITVTFNDGTVSKYEGSGTVWQKHPYMERCDSRMERILCDIWSHIKK